MSRIVMWAAMAASVWASMPVAAQSERVDLDVVRRIREEGLVRSRVDSLAGYLTDVIGPRLTGSSNMRRARAWAVSTLRGWQLDSAWAEAGGPAGPGWENEYAFARMLSPYPQTLHVGAVAGSAGTNGRVSGHVVLIEDPIRSTAPAAEYVARVAGKLRGAWVMSWTWRPVPVDETDPEFYRIPDDSLVRSDTRRAAAAEAVVAPPPVPAQPPPDWSRVSLRFRALDSLLRAEGALGTLGVSAPQPYGLLTGYGVQRWGPDGRPQGWSVDRADSLVRLDLTYEQYGQIWRNLRRGVPVAVEAEVRNRVLTDDPSSYNVFADLRGADKAGDYVMIGAHLDSWHVGTGATDNAAGVVVMMEALRILRALDLRPRRTIRLALWDPEERGPWGSQQWLSAHPELHARISAYLNVDVGSGRLRAVRLESNPQAASMFEQILAPFRDLGIVGTVPERAFGTTDHESFNRVGIPGFAFAQDPLDYWQRTHHTSADTYERLNIDDLKQAAIVIAGTAWAIANREEPVPRGAAAAR